MVLFLSWVFVFIKAVQHTRSKEQTKKTIIFIFSFYLLKKDHIRSEGGKCKIKEANHKAQSPQKSSPLQFLNIKYKYNKIAKNACNAN